MFDILATNEWSEELKTCKAILLLIMVLGSVCTSPLASYAGEKSQERATRSQQSNSKKVRIIAAPKDEEIIKGAIKKICAKKSGKELIQKITRKIEITVEKLNGTNVLYCANGVDVPQIKIDPKLLRKKFELEKVLSRELSYFVQHIDDTSVVARVVQNSGGKSDKKGLDALLENMVVIVPESDAIKDTLSAVDGTKVDDEFIREKGRKLIQDALRAIYATKIGKEIIQKLPTDMKFKFEDLGHARGRCGLDHIRLHSDYLFCVQNHAFEETLIHELQHCIQNEEQRKNFFCNGDGIEGYVDFVTRKLHELEASLTANLYAFEIGDKGAMGARYYRKLRKKYQEMGLNEDKIDKAARTEYVKDCWEANENTGPVAFQAWAEIYNDQIYNFAKKNQVGKRDIEKEYRLIQSYIDAMGVDLTVDYFMNPDNWHLPPEQLALHTEREEQARKLEKKTCLNLCSSKK